MEHHPLDTPTRYRNPRKIPNPSKQQSCCTKAPPPPPIGRHVSRAEPFSNVGDHPRKETLNVFYVVELRRPAVLLINDDYLPISLLWRCEIKKYITHLIWNLKHKNVSLLFLWGMGYNYKIMAIFYMQNFMAVEKKKKHRKSEFSSPHPSHFLHDIRHGKSSKVRCTDGITDWIEPCCSSKIRLWE